MTKIYSTNSKDTIDLQTFHKNIDSIKHEKFTEEFIDDCAIFLGQLANNENLLEQLLSNITSAEQLDKVFSAPQSFMLGMGTDYYLRVNVWLPEFQHAHSKYENAIYAYDLAHNHDFHLLTVGYFGNGYVTDLYEISNEDAVKTPGQEIQLTNHLREQLSKGKVIYFKPYNDVHVQHHPSNLSISINLIFINDDRPLEQLLFNVKTSKIEEYLELSVQARCKTAIDIASLIGNQDTLHLLRDLSEQHPHHRVRNAAKEVLNESV